MRKIRLTIEVDGDDVTRDYVLNPQQMEDLQYWGGKVVDMIDTINKLDDDEF